MSKTSTKTETKAAEGVVRPFHFPDEGVTVEAESYEAALKQFNKQQQKDEQEDGTK